VTDGSVLGLLEQFPEQARDGWTTSTRPREAWQPAKRRHQSTELRNVYLDAFDQFMKKAGVTGSSAYAEISYPVWFTGGIRKNALNVAHGYLKV